MSSEPAPLKKFGQHFLSNPYTLQRMLDEISPTADENFIEIGPGTGALTLPLSQLCHLVIALEVDKRMLEFLGKSIATNSTHSNIQLVPADALKDDIASIISGASSIDLQDNQASFRLVGNLPYNISVHLIEKFLLLTNFNQSTTVAQITGIKAIKEETQEAGNKEIGEAQQAMTKEIKEAHREAAGEATISGGADGLKFKDMHFLVQKEIAQRLFAEVGDGNYGRLSIMVWAQAKGSKVFNLPPSDFSPPPKVNSSFIQMQPQLHPEFSDAHLGLHKLREFNQLITAAFSRPNRRMRNNLKNYPQIMEALTQLNLADKRPRETAPEEFIAIINLLANEKDAI